MYPENFTSWLGRQVAVAHIMGILLVSSMNISPNSWTVSIQCPVSLAQSDNKIKISSLFDILVACILFFFFELTSPVALKTRIKAFYKEGAP